MHNVTNIVKNVFPDTEMSDTEIMYLGGMTNKNYIINIDNTKYVLRVPGAMTQELINRSYESINSVKASEININVGTYFFDEKTGIKVTYFLENSYSLTHQNIRNYDFLAKIAKKLKLLHQSAVQFYNRFNVFNEYKHYFSLLKNKNDFYQYHPEMINVIHLFESLSDYFDSQSILLSPCHNDLVPENILIKDNDIYFIDWEYSGMNDPLFDIAAFFLECNLNLDEKKFFLSNYYQEKIDFDEVMKKISYYQFTQDVLWFLWTLIKEENQESFGDYAENRILRAIKFMKDIKERGY